MAEQEHKKSRPMYIADYLRRKSDENHWVSQKEIMDYLYSEFDIMPDRKTIKRDIAMLRDEMGMDIEERPHSGYRLLSREFELDDLKILAECVYAAKFISEERSKELVDLLCEFCSENQAKKLKREVYLVDRVKTTQSKTLYTINTIREAMQTQAPSFRGSKIGFLYITHSVTDVHKIEDKHNGKIYKVSPYKLVINDGNYYLIGFEDDSQEVRTYRIDRMRDVKILDEPRVDSSKYNGLSMKSYIRRTFSMFGGERTKVEMRFENSLLDTVIDKFGVGFGAEYRQDGDGHFIVTADVDVSDQFFGWLCGFGPKVRMLSPSQTVKQYIQHLKGIYGSYV